MFKFIVLFTICSIMFAESKPTNDINIQSTNTNHRVVRSAELAQNVMTMAGQLANEGIQAATQGLNILSSVAQQGVSAGTSIASQVIPNLVPLG